MKKENVVMIKISDRKLERTNAKEMCRMKQVE